VGDSVGMVSLGEAVGEMMSPDLLLLDLLPGAGSGLFVTAPANDGGVVGTNTGGRLSVEEGGRLIVGDSVGMVSLGEAVGEMMSPDLLLLDLLPGAGSGLFVTAAGTTVVRLVGTSVLVGRIVLVDWPLGSSVLVGWLVGEYTQSSLRKLILKVERGGKTGMEDIVSNHDSVIGVVTHHELQPPN